jgi:cell division transport system permease protein
MRARLPGMQTVLDELGSDTLPASLEISLNMSAAKPSAISQFAGELSVTDFSDVDYGQEWIERFQGFLALLKLLGAIMGSLILVAALFLVMNTVHLIVYNRRDELEIQKLVGATNGYILAPFLLEGFVQGLLGAAVSLTGLAAVHRLLVARLRDTLDLSMAAELQFLPYSYSVSLVIVAGLLGFFASWVGVQRFLTKVP